jgi:diguanylate cyclase (GGDEF)-like protein
MSGVTAIAFLAAALAVGSCGVVLTRLLVQRRNTFRELQDRSSTINRLLAFSQTIQGAGKAEQIYPTLCHYLRMELGLSSLVLLTHDTEALPATHLGAAWPENLAQNGAALAEVDTSLPWQFQPGASPVRCSLDAALSLPPSHPAYCIPFSFGRRVRVVVHMLMRPGEEWTDHRRQLAQTYVNSAQAVLSALQLLADAEKQSMTDALTGLYNRRSLDQLLMRETALAERYGHPLAVVMLDLDCFKAVNDTHGHAAGDHVLKAFADCVRITLRKTDLAFRYGGDEFVIALPQTSLAQAQQVIQKLRQAFATVDFSHAITRLQVQPTLSMGVVERSASQNVLSMSQMLSAADQALYAAKSGTPDCIKVFEPPQAA